MCTDLYSDECKNNNEDVKNFRLAYGKNWIRKTCMNTKC